MKERNTGIVVVRKRNWGNVAHVEILNLEIFRVAGDLELILDYVL